MSLRIHLTAAILLGVVAVAAADPPEDLPRLRQYTQGTQPVFRFGVFDGHVVMRCRRPMSFQISSDFGGGQKEMMSLRAEQAQTVINYQRVSAKEDIRIDVAGVSGKVSISRSPRDGKSFTAMEFSQTPGEETRLTLGTGDRRQVFQAADLWRLALARPKECQEHLFPMLDALRQDRKLAPMVARIEATLLSRSKEDISKSDTHWAELVEQLADDRFAKREAADRALRAGGAAALGYLRQLDFQRLDAEQQFRVRRILAVQESRSEDDLPEEIAASLMNDRETWLGLLGRTEPEIRKTAARQLAKLLGEKIDVDPAADPDSQKEKREKLWQRIEKKK